MPRKCSSSTNNCWHPAVRIDRHCNRRLAGSYSVVLTDNAYRTDNGYRSYQPADIARLVFIRRCRELNIAIDDIRQLIDVQQNPQASCRAVDELIAKQLARIRQTQQELALLETSLSSLAASCAQQLIKDCAILHQLKCV